MTRKGLVGAAGTVALACLLQSAPVGAQAGSESLASVRIPRKVLANGQPLAAGTYAVRLSTETVAPVVGESTGGSRWVEFVQGEQVKGRELATVVAGADLKQIAKSTPPSSGGHRVDVLKGNNYVRVWINKGGTHYLIHLATAS